VYYDTVRPSPVQVIADVKWTVEFHNKFFHSLIELNSKYFDSIKELRGSDSTLFDALHKMMPEHLGQTLTEQPLNRPSAEHQKLAVREMHTMATKSARSACQEQ